MNKLMVLHYHGYRALQTGGQQGIDDLQALAKVSNLLVGVPWQHWDEEYWKQWHRRVGICWTIGAHERPTDVPLGWRAWDCEGGGDPLTNARWFRSIAPNGGIVYSGYPGLAYSGQSIAQRYGCAFSLIHRQYRRWYGWPRPLPICACGGIRGPLPAHALDGMPSACPVLHAIASPDPQADPIAEWIRVRSDVKDRLRWIRCRGMDSTDGLCIVQAVDGPAGARWSLADSMLCRIITEELAI